MDTNRIIKEVNKIEDDIIKLRHRLHQNPELGYEEYDTSKLVTKTLKSLNLVVDNNIYTTGVSALLKGQNNEQTILLRADMDALAIQEKTDLPYASKKDGVMHACGHDVHTAIVLGAAVVLKELEAELKGNVKFVFQPAEEQEGGALGMIENGVLEKPKVDAALGLHVWGSAQKGTIEIKYGSMMASPDRFLIKIKGEGGHAANPHQCKDPIVIATEVVQKFQNIISRKLEPTEPAVLSVCHIEGGNTHNVIPDEVLIEGTVRTLTEKTRHFIPEVMEKILANTTNTYEADYELDYEYSFPPLINNKEMTDLVSKSADKIMGEKNVIKIEKPNMGGEDFAYFAQEVPSSYFYLGIAPSKDEVIKHHNSYFKVDDEVIADGIAVLVRSVFDYFDG
mgnify:CR=1 FL=1